MPEINIPQLLSSLDINTNNLLLNEKYLVNAEKQESVLNSLRYLLYTINKDYSLTERSLPILVACEPDHLINLHRIILSLKYAKKHLSESLVLKLIICAIQCGDETYRATNDIVSQLSLTHMSDLEQFYEPEKITNVHKLITRDYSITHLERFIILKHSYLLNNNYYEVLVPIFNILKNFSLRTLEVALESIKKLAIDNALSLSAVESVLKHGTKISLRAKTYYLCHKNKLENISSLLAAQKNIGINHFKILNLLENHRLLNTEILVEWNRVNPSNEFAGKQYAILFTLSKYQKLNARITAKILKLNLKQLKSLTINDWATMLNLTLSKFNISWPNKTLFTRTLSENSYLEDLAILSYIITMTNQYSVTITQELLIGFICTVSNESLLSNRVALINLVHILEILNKQGLLTNNILTKILFKQLPLYSQGMTLYLSGIAYALDTDYVKDRLIIDQMNRLFELGHICDTPFSKLLAIFIPELSIDNNLFLGNIDILERNLAISIDYNRSAENKIRILAEIIKLYEFLKKSNNYTDELFLKIIKCGLISTTKVNAKFDELYTMFKTISIANDNIGVYQIMHELLDSSNITYLTSLQSKLRELDNNNCALYKLYRLNYFVNELVGREDLDSYLYILDVLSVQLKLLCDKNLFDLHNTRITESFKQVLTLIQESSALTQDTFVFALNYSEMFVNEDGSVLPEIAHVQPEQMNKYSWSDLIEICKSSRTRHERKLAIKSYMGNNVLAHDPRFNVAQSTHTASVHLSTDITFWLLKSKYPDINYSEIEEKLYQDIENYKQSKRYQEELGADKWSIEKGIAGVAIIFSSLAIAEITLSVERKQEALTFMGKMRLFAENSEIQALESTLISKQDTQTSDSVPRFILLLYREIMHNRPDPENEFVVIEAFLKSCYEVVRGYNLDSRGADRSREARDHDICAGGVANKFCEILIDQSLIILFYFVAPESITRKIQAELFQHTRRTYTELCMSNPIAARNDFLRLSDNNQSADVLTEVWDVNKPKIQTSIHGEFFGFLDTEQLDNNIEDFANNALPYIPSPCHFTARRFYSADFIEWFNASNRSLTAANQGIRKYGAFKDDAESLDVNEEKQQEPEAKRHKNGN